jgi:hypothetical protein
MLVSEIGKIPLCASSDSLYSQKNSYQESMVEEEVQIKDNEEAQRDLGYIEGWLQTILKEGKHFLFQQFLASHLLAPGGLQLWLSQPKKTRVTYKPVFRTLESSLF